MTRSDTCSGTRSRTTSPPATCSAATGEGLRHLPAPRTIETDFDYVQDGHHLGEVKQRASFTDMVFGIPQLIERSRLLPGDPDSHRHARGRRPVRRGNTVDRGVGELCATPRGTPPDRGYEQQRSAVGRRAAARASGRRRPAPKRRRGTARIRRPRGYAPPGARSAQHPRAVCAPPGVYAPPVEGTRDHGAEHRGPRPMRRSWAPCSSVS